MVVRPVINIPYTAFEIIVESVSILGLFFAVVVMSTNWSKLPDRIPLHFGLDGRPDGWGSKNTLVVFPTLCLILYMGLTLLQRYPHIYNYPFALTPLNVERQYHLARTMVGLVKLELVWSFALIEWQAISVGLGRIQSPGVWLLLSIMMLPLLTLGVGIFMAYCAR